MTHYPIETAKVKKKKQKWNTLGNGDVGTALHWQCVCSITASVLLINGLQAVILCYKQGKMGGSTIRGL
jgi:hypothetical protein